MNFTTRASKALALCLCVIGSIEARAIDITPTLSLERYSNLNGDTVQYDVGNLLKNGQFNVVISSTVDTFGIFIDDALLGRPIMEESLYEAYKAEGVIPSLARSKDDFFIGDIPYVIVATKGDPNPIPVINTQPQSQRVLAGNPAYFWVDADPILYLSYQWTFKNKPLSGQTSWDLWISNVTPANAGIYTVALNTGGSSVQSQKVLLTVVQPVAIKTQPKSQTVKAGKNAVFRVAVTGTGPFTYQWYGSGDPIPGATSSFYTVSKVQTNGDYRVLVGNGLSSASSADAVLTVTH